MLTPGRQHHEKDLLLRARPHGPQVPRNAGCPPARLAFMFRLADSLRNSSSSPGCLLGKRRTVHKSEQQGNNHWARSVNEKGRKCPTSPCLVHFSRACAEDLKMRCSSSGDRVTSWIRSHLGGEKTKTPVTTVSSLRIEHMAGEHCSRRVLFLSQGPSAPPHPIAVFLQFL